MSTNNKVFQVLVTKGNKALAAEGTKVDALADGQLGIFDANTNLAVSAAVKKFYLAVGVDSDGDGVVDNIAASAGQEIQKDNFRDFTYKPHTAARDMVFDIIGYDDVKCDTDYAVKFEFRNAQIYARQGYNQFAKTFAIRTACCEAGSTTGTVADLTAKLVEALNADESGMFTAESVDSLNVTTAPTVAGNIVVTIGADTTTVAVLATETPETTAAKIAAAITADTGNTAVASASGSTVQIGSVPEGTAISVDAGTTLAVVEVVENSGVRVTTNSLAVNKFCDVNTKYYKPRTTIVVPSLIEGFNCTGKIVIVEEGKPEEGSGYDIRQKEYHAGGWNGKPGPYRASTAVGLAMPGFEYLASDNIKYDQFHLVYDHFSTAGWGEYLNNLMTIVAIPATDTVTRDAFATAMNVQLTALGFESLVDDATAASVDPTVVEATPPASTAVDGIA